MSNNYSQNLLELAKNEHVPETAQIWAEWSIQTALDKEIQQYGPTKKEDEEDQGYNAREPTTSEESVFDDIQKILHTSDGLEETVERITDQAHHYQQALEDGHEVEDLTDTTEGAYETIPALYFGILKEATTEFYETLDWVENYEQQNNQQ